jgi:hypothetical protein
MFLISFSFKFKSWQHSDFIVQMQSMLYIANRFKSEQRYALPDDAAFLHLIIAQRFVNVNV